MRAAATAQRKCEETHLPDGTVLYGWVREMGWDTSSYRWPGRYLHSFFLSITDKGDESAQTDTEKMWTSMQHMVYEFFMAYLTGVFAGEVIQGNAAKQKYDEKMDQVKHFMHHYHLPYELKQQVNAFYTHLNNTKTFFDEEAVLKEFPPAIRKKVIYGIYKNIVDNGLVQIHYPFLSRLPERLRYELCLVLKPLPAVCGDVIYTEGEYGDEMYLMDSGVCVAYKFTGDTSEGYKRLQVEERNRTISGHATGMLAEGLTLHVRGIGGPTAEPGVYESAQALRAIFEEFGSFSDAMVRHRVDETTGRNTSWALVTMGDVESAQRALEVSEAGGVLRPDGVALRVTAYSPKTAAESKGAMGRTRTAVETMDSRVQELAKPGGDAENGVDMHTQHHEKYGDLVGQFNDGSFFGEEALLGDNIKRIATVVAVAASSHIWYLDRATFSSFSRQEDVQLFYKELRSFARKRQRLNEMRAKRLAQLDSRLLALKRQFSITNLLAGGGLPSGARIPNTDELPMIDAAFSPLTLGDVRNAVRFRCVALDFQRNDGVWSTEEAASASASASAAAGGGGTVSAAGGLGNGVYVLISGELSASLEEDSTSSDATAKQQQQQSIATVAARTRATITPGTVFSGLPAVKKVKALVSDGSKHAKELLPHPAGVHVHDAVVVSEKASALWLDGRLFDFAHDPNSLEAMLGEGGQDAGMESEEEEDDADDANGVIASGSGSHGGGTSGGRGGSGSSGADGVSTRKLAAQTMQMKEQLSGMQAQMSELRHDVRGKMVAIEASNASMQASSIQPIGQT